MVTSATDCVFCDSFIWEEGSELNGLRVCKICTGALLSPKKPAHEINVSERIRDIQDLINSLLSVANDAEDLASNLEELLPED